MQTFIHYFLHFGFPLVIAIVFFRKDWKKVYGIFLLTMLVDLDHLLAEPIYLANRCSVGYHYLHSYFAIIVYFILLFFKKPIRIIALGLLMHMVTDFIDCMILFYKCIDCAGSKPIKVLIQWIYY